MADILPFKAVKKKARRSQGMCQHGHHSWQVWKGKQFDVKQGKLVTVYRCKHCDAQKVKTH
jgi:hypothetical protein